MAARKHVPVIADEVYAGMVFAGNSFYALASLADNVRGFACGLFSQKWFNFVFRPVSASPRYPS